MIEPPFDKQAFFYHLGYIFVLLAYLCAIGAIYYVCRDEQIMTFFVYFGKGEAHEVRQFGDCFKTTNRAGFQPSFIELLYPGALPQAGMRPRLRRSNNFMNKA
jgi:hypothetical protein